MSAVERHALLRRQINRHLGPEEGWPEEWRAFIRAVDDAYRESDEDRLLIERSLELSSQELLQANLEMRALFAAFPDLFFCASPSGAILHCYAGPQTGFYLAADKLLGRRLQDIPIPEVARRFEEALARVSRDNAPFSVEYAIGEDEERRYYEARLIPMPGPQVGVFIRDITARRRAENELQLTQFAIEHMGEAALWARPDGSVFYANGTASDRLGFAREELLAMSLFEIAPAQYSRESWTTRWREARTRRAFTLEADYAAKSGKLVPMEVSVNFIVFGDKEYYCTFARDVTDRRSMELAARRSEKMSAVGQLAAGVAHEINNPLTVILGFAQSLRRRADPAGPEAGPLASIEREAIRCRNLAYNLLAFARDKRPGRAPADPLAVLTGALSLVEVQAKMKNIAVRRDIPPSLPQARINADQIQQVLINLCSNAMDAMPGGGTLTVGMAADEKHLTIRVADTGAGIEPNIRERIFEPFFTTKPVGKGTGLGLSMTYEIVSGHQGRIDLRSEVGRGSEFVVLLPLTPPETA